jgi:spore maturation protein CgeB
MIKAMAGRGYKITFYEPDSEDRRKNRDLYEPDWATVVVYGGEEEANARRAFEAARHADILIKASSVGVFDELLEAAVASAKRASNLVAFWDMDAPATLERIVANPRDPFRALIPEYDLILTYGGGDPVVRGYESFGAQQCVPIYNGLDAEVHHAVAADPRFASDLSLLANRLPHRDRRVHEFFFRPAALLRHRRFLLGGNGWVGADVPGSVVRLGHVYTADHNAFNCSARAVLNVARDGDPSTRFSPAARVFEAAGAAACIITDARKGVERFLDPGREILVARSGDEVVELLAALTPEKTRKIGSAARLRALAEHTYAHRAQQLDRVLGSS